MENNYLETDERYSPGRAAFIGEPVEPFYPAPPQCVKSPVCPAGFIWRGEAHPVAELLAEWKDFTRRGRLARSMQPAHLRRALRFGSRGAGRFCFRVRTDAGRVFDLYYDRSGRDADGQAGHWFLFREFNREK